MKDKILECLNSKKNLSLTIIEINDLLKLKTPEELRELNDVLDEMCSDGEIYYSEKKKRYTLITNTHYLKGKIIVNAKGYGFVIIGEGHDDVYINAKNLLDARDSDIVLIEVIDKRSNEGKVIKVLKRDESNIIGEFYTENGKNFVKSDQRNGKIIEIPNGHTMNAVPGHKVVVMPFKDNTYLGEVIAIIGHKNDIGVDILSYAYQYGFDPKYSDEEMKEVNSLPSEVLVRDLSGRIDLRRELIFTIDGDDTKDIDDAVSLKKLDNGLYELGVYIADVSYYVKQDGEIDKDAFKRGTSVYLVDRVIPMLPHQLSNGICSLNPNTNRLALSCVMKINNKGEVVDYRIFESVICSKKQMTYNNVNKILEENTIPEGYEEFADNLKLMKELSDILRSKMVRRGYLEFDNPEAKILVNEKCEPIDIVLRSQRTGEKLIENFMIVANETVAGFVEDMDLPGIYRVHDKPNPEKLKTFIRFLSLKGYSFNMDVNKIKNYSYQKMLEMFKDKEEGSILSSLAIQTMAKAKYSNVNIGHFGLGSKRYSHFTSPIRRYPDLTLHRLVKDYLRKYSTKTISKWEKLLPVIADHSSIKEQDSINCERDVEKMKKAQYMEGHIGEVFKGVVSGVCEFGIFVQLENTVEGLVKVEDIKGDYYVYDKELGIMVGKNSKNRYMFGDVVTVEVINASRETSMVDFKIVKDVDYGEKKKK